jgi:hypothetical protein
VLPKKPGVNMTGLTLFNLLALGGLIWLARRTAHWEKWMGAVIFHPVIRPALQDEQEHLSSSG